MTNSRVVGWTVLLSLAAGTAMAADAHIKVQHILIAFSGTVPGKPVTRSKQEAEKLAKDLLKKAKKNPNGFDELVKKYTDDAAPGIYAMCNEPTQCKPGEYPRQQMVPAFGDVGFKLKVGQIGMANYDPKSSPFGYHIIKRLKND